jgi:S1-C subfamily serine protease
VIVRIFLAIVASAIAYAAVWPASALAQAPRGQAQATLAAAADLERTLADLIARAERSVVAIVRFAPARPPDAPRDTDVFAPFRQAEPAAVSPAAVGCGVIIDPRGHVLTEYLVVGEGARHEITTVDGVRYAAAITGADPKSGLAVLAIGAALDGPLQPAEMRAGAQAPRDAAEQPPFAAIAFGDAAQLRKGHFVVVIGNPYAIHSDGQPAASCGIVTNLARKAPAGTNLNGAVGPQSADFRTTVHHLGTLIQTDAKLGWSAGGGALVNLRGELVGLTTAIGSIAGHEQPAGYAIPMNGAFRRIIAALQEGREVEYGLLGVSFRALLAGAAIDGHPLTVANVVRGSPADEAGLQAGDVITHVDGRRVEDVDAMQLTVSLLPPMTTTQIGFTRRGEMLTAETRLSKLAAAGKKIVTNRPPSWRGIHVDYATALDAAALVEANSSAALDAEGCVLVAEVEQDSAAWKAGVRSGMFISHVGGRRVTTPDEFRLAARDVGDELDIRLTRPIDAPADKLQEPNR